VTAVNVSANHAYEWRYFASSEGSYIEQEFYSTTPTLSVTAKVGDVTRTRNYPGVASMGGWEVAERTDFLASAERVAHEAVEMCTAKPLGSSGLRDLILSPSHAMLTIHEIVAHPTELDRVVGYEANYAGTSFVAPPEKMLGQLKYGPSFMNIQGDRTQDGGCATIGYDDDGVKAESFLIIKNGMFNDYQTSREQAPWLEWYYKKNGMPVKSHGCCNADNWSSVQFQRMPNVSLLPGADDRTWDDLIAATDAGIGIIGDGSFSIDQQRYNAQFGGQVFYEIKGGKIAGMLKDVAYQMRTPDFWNAMDMIGGKSSYEMGSSFFDGKGQPGQIGSVSHGCVPARFRNINVINTGRKA
jgi:TldD protein